MNSKKNKDIRSRKKDPRKNLDVKKINMSDVRKTLSDKVKKDDNNRARNYKEPVDNLESTKKLEKYDSLNSVKKKDNMNNKKSTSKVSNQKKATDNKKGIVTSKPNNGGLFGKFMNDKNKNFFFFKLSKIGQIMLVIYVVGILVFGFFLARAVLNKGNVVLGNRVEPTKVITTDQVDQVKQALEKDIKADSIDVSLNAYRLVVVMDLKNDVKSSKAEDTNDKAYKIVNKILPIDQYFNGSKELNNDLFIYSADVVPKDYNTNSKYIIETYKNSRMSKPSTYNLLKYRDKSSYKEVLKSLEKTKK